MTDTRILAYLAGALVGLLLLWVFCDWVAWR